MVWSNNWHAPQQNPADDPAMMNIHMQKAGRRIILSSHGLDRTVRIPLARLRRRATLPSRRTDPLRVTVPEGYWRMDDDSGEVTLLLKRWRQGDPEVLGALIPLVYAQLHTIAQGYMRRERNDHTLQPTALVNEVYMRLLNQRKITWNDRVHFFVFAARMMRNILKDHARAHLADRRGGADVIRLPLSDEVAWVGTSPEQLLDLNRALDRLEQMDPRKAQLVELRFFLALTMAEAADVLAISLATAERDLKFSRSWLHHELNHAGRTDVL
jgi:RNA polymerase sigma factor (TIGR02999 family)